MPISTGPQYEFIGSEALQRQIELLKFYPEIFRKYFFPALEDAAEMVKSGIRPNLPFHTGHLRNALGSKVLGGTTNEFSTRLGTNSAIGTRAEIGFGARYNAPAHAQYAAALNQGAVAHVIAGKPPSPNRTKKDNLLHFSSGGGSRFTAIGSVQHPGFSGRHFMEAGLETAKPGIDYRFSVAAEQVVQELAKP